MIHKHHSKRRPGTLAVVMSTICWCLYGGVLPYAGATSGRPNNSEDSQNNFFTVLKDILMSIPPEQTIQNPTANTANAQDQALFAHLLAQTATQTPALGPDAVKEMAKKKEKDIYNDFASELYGALTGLKRCRRCCLCISAPKYPCGRRIVETIESTLERHFNLHPSSSLDPSNLADPISVLFLGTQTVQHTDFVKSFMGIEGFDGIKLVFLVALETFVPALCNRGDCAFCRDLYKKEGFGLYRGVRTLFANTREAQLYSTFGHPNVLVDSKTINYKTLKTTLEVFLSLLKTSSTLESPDLLGGRAPETHILRDMLRSFGIIPEYCEANQEYCFRKTAATPGASSFMDERLGAVYRIPSVYNPDLAVYMPERRNVFHTLLQRINAMPEAHRILRQVYVDNPEYAYQPTQPVASYGTPAAAPLSAQRITRTYPENYPYNNLVSYTAVPELTPGIFQSTTPMNTAPMNTTPMNTTPMNSNVPDLVPGIFHTTTPMNIASPISIAVPVSSLTHLNTPVPVSTTAVPVSTAAPANSQLQVAKARYLADLVKIIGPSGGNTQAVQPIPRSSLNQGSGALCTSANSSTQVYTTPHPVIQHTITTAINPEPFRLHHNQTSTHHTHQ
ncbi:hypothetical protein NEDG_01828 [Nematocida displodere]|uniref:Uncharacterized protein n=1 Tax=Nematocida displodere TaxID=1805483 RepID=A0A177EIX1_9MICR|nr:hypothetical protein NEDG_01828 [Nematocida displodere]